MALLAILVSDIPKLHQGICRAASDVPVPQALNDCCRNWSVGRTGGPTRGTRGQREVDEAIRPRRSSTPTMMTKRGRGLKDARREGGVAHRMRKA